MSDTPTDLVALPSSPWDERPTELALSIDECRTALWMVRGNVTEAARILKVRPQRLRKKIQGSPRLLAEMQEAQEQLVDLAEKNILEALTDPNDAGRRDSMSRFVASSIGKKRGYGQGSNGVTINAKGPVNVSWDDGTRVSTPGDDAKVINADG